MEFTRYYGKHRQRQNIVIQEPVLQEKTFMFRAKGNLVGQIEEKCKEKNKSFSELNRILWQAYFETEKNLAWQKEVGEWDTKRRVI